MSDNKTRSNKEQTNQVVAQARKYMAEREATYREKALKMYPWICGRCGREFEGKRLRELTVHHRDHNHDNNPPDGSNWELLCIYCHENEHARQGVADAYGGELTTEEDSGSSFSNNPFADLANMIKEKKK